MHLVLTWHMSTIMANHPRRVLTPGPLSKRKERDGLDVPKPSTPTKLAKPSVLSRAATPATPGSAPSNQLLAGYLAHEFLTKGTLFSQPWDPARAESVPVSASTAGLRRMKSLSQKAKAEPSAKPEAQVEKLQRYAEVSDLLKRGGSHLPGIINPTQLARFLQL